MALPVTRETSVICNGKDDDAAIFRAIEERERKILKKDTARTGGRR